MTLTRPSGAFWATVHHTIDNFTMSGYGPVRDSQSTTSTAWGTQYRAFYVPVRVPAPCIVREMAYFSGSTSAGNIDIGIYDATGTRLVSSGSTAKASSRLVTVEVTDTTIGPGLYYLALNNDTTTDTFARWNYAAPEAAAYGVLTETLGAVTLPATATWAVNQTATFVPFISALLVTEIS